jgi:tetratricopeptide (TPR) repeat protein
MSESPGKFLNFLDQLLPFLAACPPWLRLWVHALILLNFLTIAALAVVYLSSKERATDEGSLKYFSILTPTASQQIPLTDSGTWMLTGTLPKAKDVDFNVQVLKLPDGEPIPQTGQKFKSTSDGQWSFEPAKFAGYGSYEIKAIGLLNGDSLVRTVTVICYDKATAYKLSIEREKKFRTDADILPMPAGVSSPAEVIAQIGQLQNNYITVMSAQQLTNGDLQNAMGIVNQALDLVDSALPLWPGNFDLQNARAFFLKDYAQVGQLLNRPDAKQALEEARIMFEAVSEQNPLDTNAWNGLGSVYMMNGKPAEAIFYIKRALKFAPDNIYAQHDLALATQQVEEQQKAAAGK